MTCEAFQMVCIAQGAHELAGESLAALPAYLAALGLLARRLLLLLLVRVRQRAVELAGLLLRRQAVGIGARRHLERVRRLSREAVAARVL